MNEQTPLPPPRPRGEFRTGRVLQNVFSVAILVATLAVAFSPKMFSGNLNSLVTGLLVPPAEAGLVEATPQSAAARVGIVSGHWGNGDDPGAVCPDGITERDVNLAVASIIRQKLEAHGYEVDLLQEFDPRLDGYKAAVLVSIHADTCAVVDENATGFKVAASTYSHDQNLSNRLTSCLDDRYSAATGLPFHSDSVTMDMTDYHAFSVIDQATTAAIIETGFLNLDYDILVHQPDVIADGITAGIVCFVANESVNPTPSPLQ